MIQKVDTQERILLAIGSSVQIVVPFLEGLSGESVMMKKNQSVWRCSNKLNNGKEACPHSVTLKE